MTKKITCYSVTTTAELSATDSASLVAAIAQMRNVASVAALYADPDALTVALVDQKAKMTDAIVTAIAKVGP